MNQCRADFYERLDQKINRKEGRISDLMWRMWRARTINKDYAESDRIRAIFKKHGLGVRFGSDPNDIEVDSCVLGRLPHSIMLKYPKFHV